MGAGTRSFGSAAMALLLSAALLFALPVPALAALRSLQPAATSAGDASAVSSFTDADGITWLYETREEGAYLVGCEGSGSAPGPIVLPDELGEGVEVHGVSVSSAAQANPWSAFGSVKFSAGIAVIDGGAFASCSNLRSVEFAEGSALARIGSGAFKDSGLEAICIPRGVESIGEGQFEGCAALKRLSFEGGSRLVSIPDGAFSGFSNLESVTFEGDSQLASIGKAAFADCAKLTDFTFEGDSRLVSIGAEAFRASGLKSFVMPASLKRFDSLAFLFCEDLEDFYLSDAMEESSRADGTDTAYVNPLYGVCNARFHVSADSQNYRAIDGYGPLLSKDGTVLYTSSTVNASVPAGVEVIAEAAFAYNGLESVDIPSSVTAVRKWAFVDSGLVSVSIPDSVTYLGAESFSECAELVSVTIGAGVTDLSYRGATRQFADCAKLAEVVLPGSLTKVSDECFVGTALEQVFIPASVTDIGIRAFAASDGSDPVAGALREVSGCAGVERIEVGAFKGAQPLAFAFGSNIEYVKKDAFTDSLTSAYPDYLELQADGVRYRADVRLRVSGWDYDQTAYEALGAINKERRNAGVDELVLDPDLTVSAHQRTAELVIRYPSASDARHTRPLGISYATIDAKAVNELFAIGYSGSDAKASASSVVRGWLSDNGEGSSAILDSKYQTCGIGCFLQGGTLYWDVLFGTQATGGATDAAAVEDGVVAGYDVSVRLAEGFPAFKADVSGDPAALKPGDTTAFTVKCNNKSNFSDGFVPAESFDYLVVPSSVATVSDTGLVTFKQGGTVIVYGYLKGTDAADGYGASYTFKIPPEKDISHAEVTGVRGKVYTGKEITQELDVQLGGVPLAEGVDYEVKYANNKKVGTANYTIVPKEGSNYYGTYAGAFAIKKAPQPMDARAKDKKLSRAKVKSAGKLVSAITVKGAKGKVTFKNVSVQKAAKKLTVKSSNGKVAIPKATGKRTFKLKVKVTAAGNENYKKGSKTLSFKIAVK